MKGGADCCLLLENPDVGVHGLTNNGLDCDTVKASSNISYEITFTFGIITINTSSTVPFTRIVWELNNPQRLICHEKRDKKKFMISTRYSFHFE